MSKLLVVEDDAKSRKLLCDVLSAHGYSPIAAESGEIALAIAGGLAPDLTLALLDIHLPGADGYATLAALREIPGLERLPAIAVTASVMSTDRERIEAAGFDGLLRKPIALKDLYALIKDVMARH